MKVRIQFAMDRELKSRATVRARASGLSLAEYFVSLIEKDLALPKTKIGVEAIFNLGSSRGSNVAANKHAMIAEAIAGRHPR
jgi:hypothetical protein